MRVAVEKVDGVSDAAVSLNEGHVVVILDEGNDVTLEHLREIIRNQGFTPRGAEVRMRGSAEERDGERVFVLPGSDAPYPLLGETVVLGTLAERGDRPVIVRGEVEEEGRRLRVLSVEGAREPGRDP